MRFVALLVAAAAFAAGAARAAEPADEGRLLFEQKCTACHTIGAGDRVGPDLRGVTDRVSQDWLLTFITAPEKMIAAKDEVAVRLYEKYNRIVMPTLGLKQSEAQALFAYLRAAGAAPAAATPAAQAVELPSAELGSTQKTVLVVFLVLAAVIMLAFFWIALSTRDPADVDVKRAYSLRAGLFVVAVGVLAALLIATLPGAPYAAQAAKADRVVYVAARQFEFIFSDQPVTSTADLGRVPTRTHLELPAGTLVEFRVTALDVNHGFGIYGPQHQLVAQTQAMPGYVNRLLVRLPQSGEYKVFCLEYCAAGHHLMQAGLTVR